LIFFSVTVIATDNKKNISVTVTVRVMKTCWVTVNFRQ